MRNLSTPGVLSVLFLHLPEESLTKRNPLLSQVVLWPAEGKPTQLFDIFPAVLDEVYQTVPSSAKFGAQIPDVENYGSKGSFFRPLEVILRYFPYGGY